MKSLTKKGMFSGKGIGIGALVIGFLGIVLFISMFNALFPTIDTQLDYFAANISDATGISNLGTILTLAVAIGAVVTVLALVGFKMVKH